VKRFLFFLLGCFALGGSLEVQGLGIVAAFVDAGTVALGAVGAAGYAVRDDRGDLAVISANMGTLNLLTPVCGLVAPGTPVTVGNVSAALQVMLQAVLPPGSLLAAPLAASLAAVLGVHDGNLGVIANNVNDIGPHWSARSDNELAQMQGDIGRLACFGAGGLVDVAFESVGIAGVVSAAGLAGAAGGALAALVPIFTPHDNLIVVQVGLIGDLVNPFAKVMSVGRVLFPAGASILAICGSFGHGNEVFTLVFSFFVFMLEFLLLC
jgi:hypothetical protein